MEIYQRLKIEIWWDALEFDSRNNDSGKRNIIV